jgi:hypothetical protein
MKLPTLTRISSRTGLAKGWIVLILAVFAWVLVWALLNGIGAVLSLVPGA